MTTEKPQDVLVWVDVETTGLDARNDSLLEVAVIVTDPQLNQLIDEPYHAVVRYSAREVADLYELADDVVRVMHTKSGLWQELSSWDAKDIATIDAELLEYIKQAAPERRQARVAGSSVRLDLDFLENNLRDVYDHLHYRSVDVSALMFIAEHHFGWVDPGFEAPHEALADIKLSIEKLRSVIEQTTTPRKVLAAPDSGEIRIDYSTLGSQLVAQAGDR